MKICVIILIFGVTSLICDLFVLRKIYKEKEKEKKVYDKGFNDGFNYDLELKVKEWEKGEMKMTKEKVMVLKVKESKSSRFQEKERARLFNNEEMEKFVELVSAYVSCGCNVKVELIEYDDYIEMEI